MRRNFDPLTDPPALLAIIRAARRIGDRGLEQSARQRLALEYGIEVRFIAKPDSAPRLLQPREAP